MIGERKENERKRADCDPLRIADEYRRGIRYKNGMGDRGLYEQCRMNERFYIGDQWYGANCGSERPLVRYNVIKRIGDYKMAVIGGSPVSIRYSAEGVPNTLDDRETVRRLRKEAAAGKPVFSGGAEPENGEINLVMSALTDYFRTTAERVKFDDRKGQVLRDAYQTGTGLLYTYWDERVRTGLYAGWPQRTPITGDIVCETLDVENVYFGDPGLDSIQEQPYILIAQRKSVAAVREEARRNGAGQAELSRIQPDPDTADAAREEDRKATVLTRFWKEKDQKGNLSVLAARVCGDAVVRPVWNLGVRLYPLAKFVWERKRNAAYGESEITWLIPNQIAINRMLTAGVWSAMMTGMPMMVVNGDSVPGEITNDPGQILRVYGDQTDVAGAVRYISPPGGSPFGEAVSALIADTLAQAGANEAALGDMQPNNTSAILALREAATLPLQPVQERFYSFCEDVARIWAEFWLAMYGDRQIKIEDGSGVWYLPFRAERYRNLLISARVDVGGSALWSETQTVRTLDNLLDKGVIDAVQYLRRLPKGAVPDREELIRDCRPAKSPAEGRTDKQSGGGFPTNGTNGPGAMPVGSAQERSE